LKLIFLSERSERAVNVKWDLFKQLKSHKEGIMINVHSIFGDPGARMALAVVLLFYLYTPIGCAHPKSRNIAPEKTIRLESAPEAEIFLNGDYQGRTPHTRLVIKAGDRLEIKSAGYETAIIEFGTTSAKSIQITRAKGHRGIKIKSGSIFLKLKKEN
jgi:hypothetical protein